MARDVNPSSYDNSSGESWHRDISELANISIVFSEFNRNCQIQEKSDAIY